MASRKLRVGNVVEITWTDSGYELHATRTEIKTAKLAERKVYGRITAIKDETVTLGMDLDEEDQGTYGLIWIPSIKRVRRLG